MGHDPKGEDSAELRVEHVLAALDQIGTLSAQLRTAVGGLDPKMVLGRVVINQDPTPGSELAGHCRPPPQE